MACFGVVKHARLLIYFRGMNIHSETSVVRISHAHPRRNLPNRTARGRKEGNFVIAFGQAYVRQMISKNKGTRRFHATGRELSIAGFGIADFVWVAWRKTPNSQEGTGLSRRSAGKPQKATVLAFEMKLKDWRKALAQAFRYRYFADAALVVLPPQTAIHAQRALSVFRDLQVGLWSFDNQTQRIREIFTPRLRQPLSDSARRKAISILTHKLRIPPVS
jgi:hypothetical protein